MTNIKSEESEVTEVVYNACFGGFSVSDAAVRRYAEIKGITLWVEKGNHDWFNTYWTVPPEQRIGVLKSEAWHKATDRERQISNDLYTKHTIDNRSFSRTDPVLVQVVKELGDAANGACAELAIADILAGEKYRIDEYDGRESVMTADDYQWETA